MLNLIVRIKTILGEKKNCNSMLRAMNDRLTVMINLETYDERPFFRAMCLLRFHFNSCELRVVVNVPVELGVG